MSSRPHPQPLCREGVLLFSFFLISCEAMSETDYTVEILLFGVFLTVSILVNVAVHMCCRCCNCYCDGKNRDGHLVNSSSHASASDKSPSKPRTVAFEIPNVYFIAKSEVAHVDESCGHLRFRDKKTYVVCRDCQRKLRTLASKRG